MGWRAPAQSKWCFDASDRRSATAMASPVAPAVAMRAAGEAAAERALDRDKLRCLHSSLVQYEHCIPLARRRLVQAGALLLHRLLLLSRHPAAPPSLAAHSPLRRVRMTCRLPTHTSRCSNARHSPTASTRRSRRRNGWPAPLACRCGFTLPTPPTTTRPVWWPRNRNLAACPSRRCSPVVLRPPTPMASFPW